MADSIDQEIADLLKRKQEIDFLQVGQFTETNRWLVDACNLLLRSVLELRAGLVNAGLLPEDRHHG